MNLKDIIDNIQKQATYLIGGGIIGIGLILGANSLNNNGKYNALGEFIEDGNYTGNLREEIIIKDTRNRIFGADYIEKRDEGIKIKYFENKKGGLESIKYNGEKYSRKSKKPRNNEILENSQKRLNDIKKFIRLKEDKKAKEKINELKEQIYIKNSYQ